MTPKEFNDIHQQVAADCLEICKKKQQDYATEGDVFSNFRQCDIMGLCPVEVGLQVRLNDKMSRLANCVGHGCSVENETVDDTIKDAINYLILLHAFILERKVIEGRPPKGCPPGMLGARVAESLKRIDPMILDVKRDKPEGWKEAREYSS